MSRSGNYKQKYKILLLIVVPSMIFIMSVGITSMNAVILVPTIPQTETYLPSTVTTTVTETMTDYIREPDTTETLTEYHTTTINNPRFNLLSSGVIYILTGTLALGGGMLLAWSYERLRGI